MKLIYPLLTIFYCLVLNSCTGDQNKKAAASAIELEQKELMRVKDSTAAAQEVMRQNAFTIYQILEESMSLSRKYHKFLEIHQFAVESNKWRKEWDRKKFVILIEAREIKEMFYAEGSPSYLKMVLNNSDDVYLRIKNVSSGNAKIIYDRFILEKDTYIECIGLGLNIDGEKPIPINTTGTDVRILLLDTEDVVEESKLVQNTTDDGEKFIGTYTWSGECPRGCFYTHIFQQNGEVKTTFESAQGSDTYTESWSVDENEKIISIGSDERWYYEFTNGKIKLTSCQNSLETHELAPQK